MDDSILNGKIFISTRPAHKSAGLKNIFSRYNASLLEFPTIEIIKKELSDEEVAHIQNIEKFNWVIFSSTNGVNYFFYHLKEITGSTTIPANTKIAVIGNKTAESLSEYRLSPALINKGTTGLEFTEDLNSRINLKGASVLVITGNLAPNTITDSLKGNALVTRINVYNTIIPAVTNSDIFKIVKDNCYDMIIFTSPSAIHNFLQLTVSVLDKAKIRAACIGPVTAAALSAEGIEPFVVSKVMSDEGIVNAIRGYFSKST